jgi:hypothetical protein
VDGVAPSTNGEFVRDASLASPNPDSEIYVIREIDGC